MGSRKDKLFIYQLLPRLFGNGHAVNKRNGSIEENGCGKFNDITGKLLKEIKAKGYTHIWYIGVVAHASTTDYQEDGIPEQYPEIVKGRAGSPYAIRDYYDVDPDLAENVGRRMREFEELIERTHAAGLKVVIDNVPNHVARNYQSIAKPDEVDDFGARDDQSIAFSPQNNFYYLPGQALDMEAVASSNKLDYREVPAKATGNDCFTHKPDQNDWYETVKLNYGVDYLNGKIGYFDPIPDTWIKMRDILLFWAAKGVDGFRCDMAEMVPLEFWEWAIPRVKESFPATIFVAEIYNPAVYRDFLFRGGFDYLYDKVGLYDVLREVASRQRPASDISFVLNEVGDIQQKMVNFLENHDEQRLASDFFLGEGKKGKAAMMVTACVNSNPVMVYAGQELGERGMDEEGFSGRDGRTTIFDYWSPDTLRRWNNNGKWDRTLLTPEEIELHDFYSNLIRLCNEEEALRQGMFYDLMPPNYENEAFDSTSLFAFLRGNSNGMLMIVVNFNESDVTCKINIPLHAYEFFGTNDCLLKQEFVLTPLLEENKKEENKKQVRFSSKEQVRIELPPNGGMVYRISLR